MAGKLSQFGAKASKVGTYAGIASDLGLSIPYNA